MIAVIAWLALSVAISLAVARFIGAGGSDD